MQKQEEKLRREAEYEFSIGLCLIHWIRAVVIVILVGTGYHISYVFQSPNLPSDSSNFMRAKYRLVHQAVGFVLIGCAISKGYLFSFDKWSCKERTSTAGIFSLKIWVEQIKFYLFLGKHSPLKGVYNPLQYVTYPLFYLMMIGIVPTGLILHTHTYHESLGSMLRDMLRPFEAMMEGLAEARTCHRILMWVVLIFVPVRTYMAIFNAVKDRDGTLDAIISGCKSIKEEKNWIFLCLA